jgi:hypothetical protein
MDGGAQIMIFLLSFAVFGAAGVTRPFPSVCVYFLRSRWVGSRAVGSGRGTRPRAMQIIATETARWTEGGAGDDVAVSLGVFAVAFCDAIFIFGALHCAERGIQFLVRWPNML